VLERKLQGITTPFCWRAIQMPVNSTELNAWDQIASWVFSIAGNIRYGSVEITIHDARVVQLEVTEKFRSPEQTPALIRPGASPASI